MEARLGGATSADIADAAAVSNRRITLGLGGGVLLEWYDWNVYGIMAAFLSPHFFPSTDPVTSLLAALAVFGAGFFARPVGAAILGPVADRISHKRVMMVSVCAMAASSLLIAILPTYERIGIWAALILFLIRVLQGLATGAEAGVANAIAIELAPAGREGRYLGLISGTFIQAGIFGSTLVAFFVSAFVTRADLVDWAWRIPFAVGGVLGLAVIYLRSAVPETLIKSALHRQENELDRVQETTGGVWKTLWKVRLSLVAVVLVIGSIQIANYAWNTGLPNMANGVFKENSTAVFGITTVMGITWIISGPFVGALADRIRLSRAFTITRLLLIPAFFVTLLYTERNVGLFAAIMIGGGAIVGFNMSLYNYVATTLMPKSVRTTGVAIGYALGVSIFGGPSAYLLVWLQHHNVAWMFPVYGSIITALSLIVYWAAKRRGLTYLAD